MKHFYTILLIALFPAIVQGQSTAEAVSAIFQANCTVGCHSGSSPSANLDLSGSPTDLVNNLVGVEPLNPAAQAKGYKLIDPGYPHYSFLLYKCAYPEWDEQYAMDPAEGQTMPVGQPVLEKEEVELIRQWILYGAKATGTAIDPQLLYDYYHVNGMARIAKPPVPENGFQMHLGPFFLEPGEEVEFYKKEKVFNAQEENVTRFDAIFNDESHHFLLFEFVPGTDGQVGEGLRPVTVQNAFQDAQYMVGWVDADSTILPEGTAYKLEQDAVVDLNYHLINYASNGDSILAAEAYVNYYTDNASTDLVEMHSELLINLQIFILNNGQEFTFTDPVYDASAPAQDSMYVWFLSSHTHKYGTDYDIYLRNPDGSRGEQLYEGFYNTTYDFNQGYYDWEHPPNLYFDKVYGDLLPVARKDGLIQEAKYQIPGSAGETAPFINFGLTTDDEMMLAFIQYTLEPVQVTSTGIEDNSSEAGGPVMSVYPNPTVGNTTIQFDLERPADVQLNIYNSMGQEVKQLHNGRMAAGKARFTFDAAENLDPNGLYLIRLSVNGDAYTQRLLQIKQ